MTPIAWPEDCGRRLLHVLKNLEQLTVQIDPSPERLVVVQTMLRHRLQLLALELGKNHPTLGVLAAVMAEIDGLACTVGTLLDELEPAA